MIFYIRNYLVIRIRLYSLIEGFGKIRFCEILFREIEEMDDLITINHNSREIPLSGIDFFLEKLLAVRLVFGGLVEMEINIIVLSNTDFMMFLWNSGYYRWVGY